jgi:LDH2 family malate/lactate/ureidoglycolate dehydrogenase
VGEGEVQQGVSAAASHRYGLDDLRRFAAAMGTAAGLTPARSLTLASHLLWFDAAGAANLGISTLPSWMEAIENGEVNPTATGRVVNERTALAILDGENGLAPLVLERAAELAVEKARESAVGVVRVVGAGAVVSAAPVAAGIAIGPTAGWVVGPNRCWSLALPSHGDLPLVVDSGLSAAEVDGRSDSPGTVGRRGSAAQTAVASGPDGAATGSSRLDGFWLGTEVLLPEGGWLVAALSIPALESFAAFDERLAAVARGTSPAPGRLLPEVWEARRRECRQKGVVIDGEAWKSVVHWARRLAVDIPDPLAR